MLNLNFHVFEDKVFDRNQLISMKKIQIIQDLLISNASTLVPLIVSYFSLNVDQTFGGAIFDKSGNLLIIISNGQ